MSGEFFDKHRLHHWHLGLAGGVICAIIVFCGLGIPKEVSVNWNMGVTVAGGLFWLWALDDAFWHAYGWKWLPCHILHEWLKKWWIYSRIDEWLKEKRIT